MVAVDHRDPWWARLLAEPQLSVIDDDVSGDALRPTLFVVARQWNEPSGDDRTWWITDAASPSAVEAALSDLGFAARYVLAVGGMGLFQVAGYVQRDDERLARAPGRLSGVIGAVPSVPR